ncbi:hypothetical protein [Clostridium sp. BJN0013]|jgi:hypothetical protein|uniref:hypothetical protein n=1 Tax=Clostridium sp. BJN0013 TaxID=3236840 RepID=UPI0034C6D53F
MNLGRRIIYDSQTGAIILDTGEQIDATEERPIWNGITYIDLDYGAYSDEFSRVIKYHIDVSTKAVVFDELSPIPITMDGQIKTISQALFIFNKAFTSSNQNAELVEAIINAINSLKSS